MTKETLFEQIDEIFGDWHGGVCYIGKERENQIKEILEKAINYNRCSTQLKDKESITFEDWLKDKYINLGRGTYQHRLYHFKKDKEQCLKIYNALEKPLIV